MLPDFSSECFAFRPPKFLKVYPSSCVVEVGAGDRGQKREAGEGMDGGSEAGERVHCKAALSDRAGGGGYQLLSVYVSCALLGMMTAYMSSAAR